ncbi:DMT family transporter [Paracnuella aquatica]|uniref:DMT family transporter n=1 Tax=Paracnuella aquatica TaxID=2268757 RepID=UPI0019D46246|nr:EamA family transporter [Paracnuella aquatica]
MEQDSKTTATASAAHLLQPESKSKGKGPALVALGLVCFLWGTTWIASRQGVKYMPALQLAAIRQVLGGLCYIVFYVIKGAPWPRGREWRTILILSLFNFVLSNGLSTWGVKFIPAGLAAIIGAIFPLWLVVIALVVDKTRPKPAALTGLAIGFGGICVIFYEHLSELFNPDFLFGILISLFATWTWAVGTLYTKKHAASFNPYFSLGLQMTISGVVLYGTVTATGNDVSIKAIPWQSWAAIAYLTVFSSVAAFVAYLYALQRLPTAQVSLYAYINPVIAIVLSALFFSEPLTVFIIVGTLITLYGVWLVNKAVK